VDKGRAVLMVNLKFQAQEIPDAEENLAGASRSSRVEITGVLDESVEYWKGHDMTFGRNTDRPRI
jgi:hypothetical protein